MPGQQSTPGVSDGRVVAFVNLLLKCSKMAGLTAFRGREEIMNRGVEPSMAALPFLPESGRALDVGSGGGIPAIPLALSVPGLVWTLCEPSPRKAAFLREVCGKLGIISTVVESDISSLVAAGNAGWDVVTVRGLKLSRGLVKRLASSLAPSGRLLVWSGGPRVKHYSGWMGDAGLAVEERLLPGADITLIVGSK